MIPYLGDGVTSYRVKQTGYLSQLSKLILLHYFFFCHKHQGSYFFPNPSQSSYPSESYVPYLLQKDSPELRTYPLSLGVLSLVYCWFPLIEFSRGWGHASCTVLSPGPSRVVPWRYVTYWQYLRTVPGPGAVLPLTFGNGAGITVYGLSGPQSPVSVMTHIIWWLQVGYDSCGQVIEGRGQFSCNGKDTDL